MKNLIPFIIFTFYSFLAISQITNFKEKFDLPDETKETSGLLFLNGKIITHNDSGNNANLFEIDSLSGNLLRTISISNATNIDWEDITEDENHIYIADIGNNNGNRIDLKIYKILKSDFKKSTSVSAEIISFSYEDQTNFDSKPNGSNFDAESIAVSLKRNRNRCDQNESKPKNQRRSSLPHVFLTISHKCSTHFVVFINFV